MNNRRVITVQIGERGTFTDVQIGERGKQRVKLRLHHFSSKIHNEKTKEYPKYFGKTITVET